MPYDPAQPADHSELKSQVVRAQFSALKAIIDATLMGPPGPPGPPFAGVVVDGVSTLAPGSAVSVTANFDGTNVHLQLGIPAGFNGSNGTNGSDGAPGEVTALALNAAIATALAVAAAASSANTNAVSTLDTGFMDPGTEAVRAKLNERARGRSGSLEK